MKTIFEEEMQKLREALVQIEQVYARVGDQTRWQRNIKLNLGDVQLSLMRALGEYDIARQRMLS